MKLTDEQILDIAKQHHCLHPGVDEWWEFRDRSDVISFARSIIEAAHPVADAAVAPSAYTWQEWRDNEDRAPYWKDCYDLPWWPGAENGAQPQHTTMRNLRPLFEHATPTPTVAADAVAPADGLLEQHHRDSAELRNLCAARDAARRTADYWKGELVAANKEIDRLRDLIEATAQPDHNGEATEKVVQPDERAAVPQAGALTDSQICELAGKHGLHHIADGFARPVAFARALLAAAQGDSQ